MSRLGPLTPHQQGLPASWFLDLEVVTDHSWGLTDTVVLQVRDRHREVIVKAGGPANHHLPREIAAHRRWTGPWLETGSIGALLHASEEAGMLAIEYLPGQLVEDVPEVAADPDTHRQAGLLLARFHQQASMVDGEYEAAADGKALAWLDRQHRISPSTEARLRAAISSHSPGPRRARPHAR